MHAILLVVSAGQCFFSFVPCRDFRQFVEKDTITSDLIDAKCTYPLSVQSRSLAEEMLKVFQVGRYDEKRPSTRKRKQLRIAYQQKTAKMRHCCYVL